MPCARYAAMLLCVAACRQREVAPPAPRSSSPPSLSVQGAPTAPGDPQGSYRVVPVTNGGSITGRIVWRGERPRVDVMTVQPHSDPGHCGATQPLVPITVSSGGGVSDAVVWLADITRGVEPQLLPAVIDQRNCRYEPRVTTVTVGAELRFSNSDHDVLHNVHAYWGVSGDDAWFNVATPAGVAVTRTVLRTGPVRLLCDAGHTWMIAYIHAFNHPYHTVSDVEGHFALRDVPAGIYRLRVWHEGWTRRDEVGDPRPHFVDHAERELPVTVPAGGRATVEVAINERDAVGAR